MNTKIYTFYAVLLILATSLFLLYGCGANPTGSGAETSTFTTITGMLDGVTQVSGEIHVNAFAHLNTTMPTKYNYTTHTYEVSNVPLNDTIYIIASQHDASYTSASYSYAYNRIDVGSGPGSMIITFETQATVEANCTEAPGCDMYGYGAYISNDDKYLLLIYSACGSPGTSFSINKLPPLKTGDCYIISLCENNAFNDGFQKDFFNVQAGANSFNMATPEVPSVPFLVFPPDKTTFETGTPTFEWQPVSWADHYVVHVYTSDMSQGVWTLVTTETKAIMPSSVATAAGSGDFNWEVEVWPVTAYKGCYFQNRTLPKYTMP